MVILVGALDLNSLFLGFLVLLVLFVFLALLFRLLLALRSLILLIGLLEDSSLLFVLLVLLLFLDWLLLTRGHLAQLINVADDVWDRHLFRIRLSSIRVLLFLSLFFSLFHLFLGAFIVGFRTRVRARKIDIDLAFLLLLGNLLGDVVHGSHGFLGLLVVIFMLLDHLSDCVIPLGLKFVCSLITDAGLFGIFIFGILVLFLLHLLKLLLTGESLLLVGELVSRFDRLNLSLEFQLGGDFLISQLFLLLLLFLGLIFLIQFL